MKKSTTSKKSTSRRTSALSHAVTLTQLAPGVAARRLAKLSEATPVKAFGMLSNMISEKSFVFARAYANSLTAMGLAQLSFLRLAMRSTPHQVGMRASGEAATLLFRTGSEIARSSLAPLAQRVRRNSH